MTAVVFYFQVHQPYRLRPYHPTDVGRNTSLAAIRAGDDIEILRRLRYDEVVSGAAEDVTIGNRIFTRQIDVEPSPTGDSKRVQVTVSWADRFGSHQVVIPSVIAP